MDYATKDKLRMRLDEYHRIVHEDDQNHSAWYNYGLILLEFGAVRKGKKALLKALKLVPKNSDYWHSVGAAYDRLGKTALTLRLYDIALELNPNNYLTLHNLSIHYYRNKKEQQAIAIWKRLIKDNPYEFEPFAYLARYYYEQKEFEKVKEVLEQTRERKQYDDSALWFIASKYFQIGEYTIAKEILKTLLQRDPEYYEFPLTLGKIYYNEDNLTEALFYYNQTIELRPFDTKLLYQKMIILARLSHTDFVSELMKTVQVNPIIAIQTLNDDTFKKHHQESDYLKVISLAQERHNFLSKPIFLLGKEFEGHPLLKRLHSHRSFAIMYHYLILLGFSRINIYFHSLDYIEESCLKHCHADLFKQGIIQQENTGIHNSLLDLPKKAFENNGIIISNKDFYLSKKNHIYKDFLERNQIKYSLEIDDLRLQLQSELFSLPDEYYKQILYEVLEIVRNKKYGYR